jgi:hypothetical protein
LFLQSFDNRISLAAGRAFEVAVFKQQHRGVGPASDMVPMQIRQSQML